MNGTPSSSRPDATSELTYFDYFGAIAADIARVCRIVWSEKLVFGVVIAIGLLCAVYVALFSREIYRAQALLVTQSSTESGGLSSLLAGRTGSISSLVGIQGDKQAREYIAGLRSRMLIYRFIQRYDMNKILFPGLWDEDSKGWKMVRPGLLSRIVHTINGTPVPPPRRGPTLEQGYRTFLAGILNTSMDPDAGTITISIDWRDPNQAALWANAIVGMFNEQKRSEVIVNSQTRIKFLQEQLTHTIGVETHEALANLIQSEEEKIVLAQSEQQFALRVIDPAVPPEDRIWPRRGLILFLGLLLGTIAGAVAAFAWAKTRHSRFVASLWHLGGHGKALSASSH